MARIQVAGHGTSVSLSENSMNMNGRLAAGLNCDVAGQGRNLHLFRDGMGPYAFVSQWKKLSSAA